MNRLSRLIFPFLLLVLLLALPGSALAQGMTDDQIIAGGNFTLESGQTHEGSLLVFGGNVAIQPGATVTGDIIVFGGNALVEGTVDGSVVGFGSNLNLGTASIVGGDLISFGGTYSRPEGAQIGGEIITENRMPLDFSFPRFDFRPRVPRVDFGPNAAVNWVVNAFWFLFRVFLTSALAVLIVLIFPSPVERTASAIAHQPFLSFVVGLLTLIVLPIILLVLLITILLFPISFIGFLFLAVMLFFGWVTLGYFLGTRLQGLFNGNWAPAVAAGVGTFVLSFIAWLFSATVPCVGWLLPWVLALFGLGAVMITRVGSQTYRGPDLGSTGETAVS